MNKQDTLKNKTISGMTWSFLDTIGTRFIQLVVHIILARLLMPEDFGIIGIVTVFIALSQTFIDSGFTKGLIREKDTTQEDYSTVFFFNLGISVIIYLLLFISAPLVSKFYKEPRLVNIIRILSFIIIINAFGLIQRTILTKSINFKVQTKIHLFSTILSGIVGTIFALQGFGVWSLIIKNLVMQFIQAVLLSLSNRWVPTIMFSYSSFKKLFSFGSKLLLSSIFTKLYENIYYLIIGRIFSVTDLGFYTNACKLKDTIVNSIATSVEKVSYPVLSSIQDDQDKLKKGYKKIIKNSTFITFPVMLGLASVAPLLLRILLGENWLLTVPYFQILCLSGMMYPLDAINLNIMQVKGRSDLCLLANILKKTIGLLSIGIILIFKLGILWLMWATVINSFLSYIVNAYFSRKVLDYPISEQISDILIYFAMSFLMSVIVLSMKYLFTINSIVLLLIQITIGVLLYLGMSIFFKVPELNTAYDIFKNILVKVNKKRLIKI